METASAQVVPAEEFLIQLHAPIQTGISKLRDPQENKRFEDINEGFGNQVEIIRQRNLRRQWNSSLRGEAKFQSGEYWGG